MPKEAEVGDFIVIIQGCQIPFVLRRRMDNKGVFYRIVGCVYVSGIMDGEAVEQGCSEPEKIEIC